MANITLDKVDAFAAAFEQRPLDLLNPLGYNSDGGVKDPGYALNVEVLAQCILEVEAAMTASSLSDPAIKAESIALLYGHKL